MEEVRQVALAYYHNFSEDEKHKAFRAFMEMDSNGDGTISIGEYEENFGTGNRRLFQKVDMNGDGRLEFEEFITLYYLANSRMVLCDGHGCKSTSSWDCILLALTASIIAKPTPSISAPPATDMEITFITTPAFWIAISYCVARLRTYSRVIVSLLILLKDLCLKKVIVSLLILLKALCLKIRAILNLLMHLKEMCLKNIVIASLLILLKDLCLKNRVIVSLLILLKDLCLKNRAILNLLIQLEDLSQKDRSQSKYFRQ